MGVAKKIGKKNQQKHPGSAGKFRRVINVALYSMLFVFTLSYIAQVNSLATKGYVIKELEQRLAEQTRVHNELRSDIIEKQSMTAVSPRIDKLGMVEAKNTLFLTPVSRTAMNQ